MFPSMRAKGRKPLYASSFVADYLRPASNESWSPYRGWSEAWASYPLSQLKQLAGEQSENRTQDRSGHPASQQDSDDTYSGAIKM